MSDTIHHAAFLMFALSGAETADDAAIERLVQDLAKFAVKKAEHRKLSYPDVMCAALEFAARVCAAAVAFHEPSDRDDKLVADMTNNFRNRMRGAMEAQAPGESDAVGPH